MKEDSVQQDQILCTVLYQRGIDDEIHTYCRCSLGHEP